MASGADEIRSIVEQVLRSPDVAALLGGSRPGGTGSAAEAGPGVFPDVGAAVSAAAAARQELAALPLDARRRLIEAMRRAVLEANESLSREAVAETGLGNVPDKVAKNVLAASKTPGVEDVEPVAWSDEHGLTLMERAPWGVIGAITPVTNPIATIASNAIGMIAAGNAVVFNVHPGAKGVSCRLVALLNGAIAAAGGPRNLLATVAEPTIESAGELMRHPGVALLVVTGGPGVVKAAMASGKKAICAGPGNPPCVVDETADLAKAGRSIVEGAGFDHNVVCICEKEVLAVASIADRLKSEMAANGAVELFGRQAEAVVTRGHRGVRAARDSTARRTRSWWDEARRRSPRAAGDRGAGRHPAPAARGRARPPPGLDRAAHAGDPPRAHAGCRCGHRLRVPGGAGLPAHRDDPFPRRRAPVADGEADGLLDLRQERALLRGSRAGGRGVRVLHRGEPHGRGGHPGAHLHPRAALHPRGRLQDHLG